LTGFLLVFRLSSSLDESSLELDEDELEESDELEDSEVEDELDESSSELSLLLDELSSSLLRSFLILIFPPLAKEDFAGAGFRWFLASVEDEADFLLLMSTSAVGRTPFRRILRSSICKIKVE